jgi:CheY-like chemotaxis protein
VELAVRDDGAGVDPVLLPQIFDRFVQSRQGIDRRAGGLGLGLAIVRQLVDLHGGSVRAESQGRNRGSTFTIQLPLRDGETDASDGGGLRLLGSEARPDPNALRILVVDDNLDAAEMLAEVLGADGHVVRVANDGPSAIEVAVELAPDVALLDIGLPVMDGFELAGQLKKRLTQVPVLMALTGYGQPADIARTRAAGFDEHFTKPLEIDRLRKRLQSIVTP